MNKEKFWLNVNKTDSCWEWLACKFRLGYGHVRYNKLETTAHRVAWMIVNGAIPEGLYVLHHCDNRSCVNPSHLFLGTALDNMRDKIEKGRVRSVCGVNHPSAKLSEEQVISIRRSSLDNKTLSAKYQVSLALIYHIKNRKLWKHI